MLRHRNEQNTRMSWKERQQHEHDLCVDPTLSASSTYITKSPTCLMTTQGSAENVMCKTLSASSTNITKSPTRLMITQSNMPDDQTRVGGECDVQDIVCIVNVHYKESNMPDDHTRVGGDYDVQETEKSRAASNGKLRLFPTQHKLQRSQHA